MRALIASAIIAIALWGGAAAAQPNGVTVYEAAESFEDTTFAVESELLDRGLVIDHVSHVGDMLNRTAEDVGAATQVYDRANVYLFCSATLSRKMMEADPNNIAHCPYGIFVYALADDPQAVFVGYRRMPQGAMQEVEGFLDAIARAASGN